MSFCLLRDDFQKLLASWWLRRLQKRPLSSHEQGRCRHWCQRSDAGPCSRRGPAAEPQPGERLTRSSQRRGQGVTWL